LRPAIGGWASANLDLIRGLAAIAVLAGHTRGLFFIPYHELSTHNPLLAAFYRCTSLGHQAVIVFFVLSGFLIVSSTTNAFARGDWSWVKYLVNRTTRLSVVLVPSLLVCLAADQAGMALRATAPLYQRPVAYLFATSVASLETLRTFCGNLFYLQEILVPTFGSNGPLWSLSYEFWYYALFPLLLCAIVSRFRPAARIGYLVAAFVVAWFVGHTIAMYFLIWMLGGAVALLRRFNPRPARVTRASAISVLLFMSVLAFGDGLPIGSAFVKDLLVATAFALWVYFIVKSDKRAAGSFRTKCSHTLAGFSYTLYAVHFPLLFLARAFLIGNQLWLPDAIHILYACAIAIACTTAAYGLAQVTELKTAALRGKVMSALRVHAPKQPEPEVVSY